MLSERRPPIFHSNVEPAIALDLNNRDIASEAGLKKDEIETSNVIPFVVPDNIERPEGNLPNVDHIVLEYRRQLALGEKEKASRTISKALRQLWPHIETIVGVHFGKRRRSYEEARKLLSCSVTKDDLMEEAHLIIINSIKSWDQNKGAPFAYYLLIALRSYLKRFDFKLCHNRVGTVKKRHRAHVSVDAPLFLSSDDTTVGEKLPDKSREEIAEIERVDHEEEKERNLLIEICLKECSLLESWIYILIKGLGRKAVDAWKNKFAHEIDNENGKYYDGLRMIYWDNDKQVEKNLSDYLKNEPIMLKERGRLDNERLRSQGKRDTRSRRRSDLINVANNPPKNEEEMAVYFYLCALRYQSVSGSIIGNFLGTSRANVSLYLKRAEKKIDEALKKQ